MYGHVNLFDVDTTKIDIDYENSGAGATVIDMEYNGDPMRIKFRTKIVEVVPSQNQVIKLVMECDDKTRDALLELETAADFMTKSAGGSKFVYNFEPDPEIKTNAMIMGPRSHIDGGIGPFEVSSFEPEWFNSELRGNMVDIIATTKMYDGKFRTLLITPILATLVEFVSL